MLTALPTEALQAIFSPRTGAASWNPALLCLGKQARALHTCYSWTGLSPVHLAGELTVLSPNGVTKIGGESGVQKWVRKRIEKRTDHREHSAQHDTCQCFPRGQACWEAMPLHMRRSRLRNNAPLIVGSRQSTTHLLAPREGKVGSKCQKWVRAWSQNPPFIVSKARPISVSTETARILGRSATPHVPKTSTKQRAAHREQSAQRDPSLGLQRRPPKRARLFRSSREHRQSDPSLGLQRGQGCLEVLAPTRRRQGRSSLGWLRRQSILYSEPGLLQGSS